MNQEDQLLIRAARLYYEENINQSDLAKILDISRPTVSRLLKRAKDKGIVKIIVSDPIEKNHFLSKKLRSLLDLKDLVVVSGIYDYHKALERCCIASIQFLETLLQDNLKIGITWGYVSDLICQYIPTLNYKNISIIQLVGCLGTNKPSYDSSRLAIKMANKLNGKYFNMYSPIYVHNKMVRDYLIKEPSINETLSMAESVDIVLSGIGSTNCSSTIYKAGYWDDSYLDYLKFNGAVGHLLGRPFNSNGAPIDMGNRYIIGAPLKTMQNANFSIGISVSKEKAESTLAAVLGRYINVLIIDEALALKLLNLINCRGKS